jgi:O-antigen ligase
MLKEFIELLFIGIISVAFFLLIVKPQLVFYVFISSLPIDALIESDIYSLPKILGLLAVLSFLLVSLKENRKLKFDIPFWVMFLLVLWGAVSYFWSADPSSTLIRLSTLVQLLILYFLIINQVRDEKNLNRMMISLFIGALIFAAFGLSDFLLLQSNNEHMRLASIARNPNWYFVVAICMVPAVYWGIAVTKRTLVRILGVALLIILFVTSIYTQSRGGLISLAIFFLVFLLLTRKKFAWVLLIMAAALLFYQIAPENYLERFAMIGYDSTDRLADLWPAGWRAFKSSPWIGYGLGASASIMPEFINTMFTANIVSVHNGLLAIGIDLGIPGIFLYLLFFLIPTLRLYRVVRLAGKVGYNSLQLTAAKLLLAVLAAYIATWFKTGGVEYHKMLWLLVGLEAAFGWILSSRVLRTPRLVNSRDIKTEEINHAY